MSATRWKENTVEVRFHRDAPKMTPNDVFNFLEKALGLDVTKDVKSLQQEYRRRVISVTLVSDTKCEEVCLRDDGGLRFRYADGSDTAVTITHAGLNNVAVRLLDLPFGMPHEVAVGVLRRFGEPCGKMDFEYWHRNKQRTNVSNGTRVIRMNLQQHIPSFVSVAGFTAVVIYGGQPKTCARCGSTQHLVRACTAEPGKRVRTFAQVADPSANLEDAPVGSGEGNGDEEEEGDGGIRSEDTPGASVCTDENTPPRGDTSVRCSSAPGSISRGVGTLSPQSIAATAGTVALLGKGPDAGSNDAVASESSPQPESTISGAIGSRLSGDTLLSSAPMAGCTDGAGGSSNTAGSILHEPEEAERTKKAERTLSLNLDKNIGFWEMSSSSSPKPTEPSEDLSWASACSTPNPKANEPVIGEGRLWAGSPLFIPSEEETEEEGKGAPEPKTEAKTGMPKLSRGWTMQQRVTRAMRARSAAQACAYLKTTPGLKRRPSTSDLRGAGMKYQKQTKPKQ